MINIFNTYIDKRAYISVKNVLKSTFLSEGKLVTLFEGKLHKLLGLMYPVAVNSGTSALHLALTVAGIKIGDEVICPAQTFIATATTILQQSAKPVFADIQYDTGNIDPLKIENKITKKTKALIVVHWAGYPADLDEIHQIAQKHNLLVIEDAAHALGASYRGKKIGAISPFTCFSFQAIKHVTTGDGGAVCFLEKKNAQEARNKRWFGIDREKDKPSYLGERVYNLRSLGFKYHLNDYAAALGLANLENFQQRLNKRRRIAQFYHKNLKGVPGLKLFNCKTDRESSYWLFGLHVEKRYDFIRALKGRGIETSVVHQRIDRNILFGGLNKDLINQERFNQTQINIPIHDNIGLIEASYIIESIEKGW